MVFNTHGQELDLYVIDVGPNRGAPWQVIKYDESGQNPGFLSAPT